MNYPIPAGLVSDTVSRALAEDLGGRGDITSLATIEPGIAAEFTIASRSKGVLAGIEAANETFFQVEPQLDVTWLRDNGEELHSDTAIAVVRGDARAVLTAERTALNFLGRMSGIASLTRDYAAAIAGTGAVVAHTRKTTPTLRAFEIAAVRAGGGAAHRFGLDDAILIKDNHVAVCGGVAEAVTRARRYAGHMTRVAVEIDRLDQLDAALKAGAESILLDNFSLEELSEAVRRVKGRVTLEASGGVTLKTVRAIAETGVNVISVGALTHSAPNFDIGLDAA
ncbi:carboxylating nicotinate-nucleotide diphosphorylase [Marinicauda sp. Alg238-R41]|uniref:carboxylating nicotinate-nucleotide diphosphorylase n=1 Tax=Marinicauda sp. Alg238-R41 TaxID=2993447 RepID=UPI0022E67BD4|nr:carboxylating nicotinate-nucleotide diphosphorylase [Marinicauda sp. Alg238-R41]